MPESRWLSRMPVYDVNKGRIVGRVHKLILDPEGRRIVGLLLATRLGREPRCLPFRNIHSIGEHALTVRGAETIMPLSELPGMEEALRSQRRVHNSPILTESGTFVGDVDEYTVNPHSGRIETLLVSGGLIRDLFQGQVALPAHLVLTIGEDATIVREQAVTFLEHEREQRAATRRGRAVAPVVETEEKAAGDETGASIQPRKTWRQRLRNLFKTREDGPERPEDEAAPGTMETGEEKEPGPGPDKKTSSVVEFVASVDDAADSVTVDPASAVGRDVGVFDREETGFEQHVADDVDDVVPPVAGSGGEGDDRET